jgi:hypothetical protein
MTNPASGAGEGAGEGAGDGLAVGIHCHAVAFPFTVPRKVVTTEVVGSAHPSKLTLSAAALT